MMLKLGFAPRLALTYSANKVEGPEGNKSSPNSWLYKPIVPFALSDRKTISFPPWYSVDSMVAIPDSITGLIRA